MEEGLHRQGAIFLHIYIYTCICVCIGVYAKPKHEQSARLHFKGLHRSQMTLVWANVTFVSNSSERSRVIGACKMCSVFC